MPATPFNVSDPEPAPMISQMPIPPQRRDWNPPPEGWSRNYSEPVPTAAAATGMNAKSLKEAQEAVEMAMRFQGMRGFQEELSRGTAPEQALLKHAHNIFFNSPAALVSAVKQAMPDETDSGPAQTVPALTAEGVPVPGVHILRSPHGYHVIHEPAPVADRQAKEGRTFQLGRIKSKLKAAEANLMFPVGTKTRTVAEATISDLEKKAESLLSGKTGSEATTAKRILKWTPNGFVE